MVRVGGGWEVCWLAPYCGDPSASRGCCEQELYKYLDSRFDQDPRMEADKERYEGKPVLHCQLRIPLTFWF